MAGFRMMLADLGAKNPRTYIASGNALVDVRDDGPTAWAAFDRSIESELESRFGFTREVISRSVDELSGAIAEHPFTVENPAWSYITFLGRMPAAESIDSAAGLPTGNDEWAVHGPHLHVRYRNGQSNSTLKLDALLKRLGVIGTARNIRTVQAILDLNRLG